MTTCASPLETFSLQGQDLLQPQRHFWSRADALCLDYYEVEVEGGGPQDVGWDSHFVLRPLGVDQGRQDEGAWVEEAFVLRRNSNMEPP